MKRELQPELLDSLAPDHPDALHNRRDLRLTNRALGNFGWFAKSLARLPARDSRTLEIGAGAGELAAHLAARRIDVDGLDLWPKPAGWPQGRTWHQTDLLTFDGYGDYTLILGNLIFHQFTERQLAELGARLRRSARFILASEPLRRRSSQVAFATIAPLFGANHVSLHDAHVSVAAGFRETELPQLLGLAATEWACDCHTTMLGAYRMIARRL
jgi:hypothetical protein